MHFIFLLLSLIPQDTRLDCGYWLTLNGSYEESEFVLDFTNVKNKDLYNFCRLVNNFSLNKKDKSIKYSRHIEDSFTDTLPYRYKILADIMSQELKTWKNGDMEDIARDMKNSQNRLVTARADKKTVQIQDQIIKKLDKLIQDEEDLINAKMQAADGKADKTIRGQGQGNPQDESQIGNNSGPGHVNEVKLKKLAQNWGTMPESERARAMMEITRDLPPRYREVIENYFKALSKTK